MSKIPVGQTISQTYALAFGRYLPNLGVIWLYYLLMGAITYFLILPAYAHMPDMLRDMAQHAGQNPQTPYVPPAMSQIISRVWGFSLLMYLLFVPIAVGVTKEALGLRTGPRFIYFDIGIREVLAIAGWIAVVVIWYVAFIVIAIIAAIIAVVVGVAFGVSSAQSNPSAFLALVPLIFVAGFAIFLLMMYIFVRLGYLMLPVTVAEQQFGVFRSWQMTKGNFWRIFLILIATLGPLLVVEFVYLIVMYGSEFVQAFQQIQQHPKDATPMIGFSMAMRYGMVTWIAGLVIAPVSYGLIYGQSAFAYRAITAPEHSAFD
jgi:hypothetical protein